MIDKRRKRECLVIESAWATSRLQPEFWEMLDEISRLEGKSLADMVEDIDRMRGRNSRSSAIRVFVLKYFQSQAAGSGACGLSQLSPALGGD